MRWLRRAGLVLATLVVIAVALGWWLARPATPGPFYESASLTADTAPGQLLKAEVFTPPGIGSARGWRILYATTRLDGTPAVASAVVIAPTRSGPVPVVAYAHGTTGVARGCAPSVFENPFPNVPGFPALLTEGWAYVGTDYPGLGTPGDHFYLAGIDAAHAVLDSVRAARQIDGLALSRKTVVWGHSQGGHAALWTGEVEPTYAPDVPISGVAAVSPASDLPALVSKARGSLIGRLITGYLLAGYDAAYPASRAWSYANPLARPILKDIASRCAEAPGILFSVGEAKLLGLTGLFWTDPLTGPLGDALRANVPEGPIKAPLLIAQGGKDDLVPQSVQDAYVKRLCAAGQALEYRVYPGDDHVSIVQPTATFVSDLIAWTHTRFDSLPATTSCN